MLRRKELKVGDWVWWTPESDTERYYKIVEVACTPIQEADLGAIVAIAITRTGLRCPLQLQHLDYLDKVEDGFEYELSLLAHQLSF